MNIILQAIVWTVPEVDTADIEISLISSDKIQNVLTEISFKRQPSPLRLHWVKRRFNLKMFQIQIITGFFSWAFPWHRPNCNFSIPFICRQSLDVAWSLVNQRNLWEILTQPREDTPVTISKSPILVYPRIPSCTHAQCTFLLHAVQAETPWNHCGGSHSLVFSFVFKWKCWTTCQG